MTCKIFSFSHSQEDVISQAQKYVDPKKGLKTPKEALAGAHEILAEAFGEDASLRAWVRKHAQTKGKLVAKVKDESKALASISGKDYHQRLRSH